VPTDEQIKQVEERYLELATPTEFDGIRTQISKELAIPKKAVKKIVKELRDRQSIPSWWEMQTYKGDSEELAKIKAAYEPYLIPLPPVGVHKTIADELGLKPSTVYQAIKAIRLEMNLPQYNDPALHGLELLPKKKKAAAADESTATVEATSPAEGVEVVTVAADAGDKEAVLDAGMVSGVNEVVTTSDVVADVSNVAHVDGDSTKDTAGTEPGTAESSEAVVATMSDGGASQEE
jgi:hypothetical protein